MKRVFIYARPLLRQLADLEEPEATARAIEHEILLNTESGDIISGTGGVRKFRLADVARSKGKRGGLRVLYLDLPHVEKTHLLFLLRKGDADDITSGEKKLIRELTAALKKESQP